MFTINPDTTTDRFIRYIWHAGRKGIYLFANLADPRNNEQGSNILGLLGAIIAEAAGSSWLAPATGEAIDSGLFADIYNSATVLLNSFEDLHNHHYHELFGAIIIEPTGANYYDGICRVHENYNETAVITARSVS